MVDRLSFKQNAVGSNPIINKNAKTASVICEKHLILDTQVNQVQRSSQGEIGLCKKFRNGLAPVNGSQGQRDRKRRVACNDKSTA